MVVVQSLEHFASRYPAEEILVAGQFTGALSNRAHTVGVEGLMDGTVPAPVSVRYEDFWHPSTDGAGYSLVLVDPGSDPNTWNEAGAWRASGEVHGSPGRADVAGLQQQGDLTQDGRLNLADVLGHLRSLRTTEPLPCATFGGNTQLRDPNGDGTANIADAIYLLSFLFRQGTPPALGTDCVAMAGCPDACE